MVKVYQGGQTVYQLAEVFGIARQAVGIILGRQRVPTRNSVSESETVDMGPVAS
jgi:hypothetical protein